MIWRTHELMRQCFRNFTQRTCKLFHRIKNLGDMFDVDPVGQTARSIFMFMNNTWLQAHTLEGVLGQLLIETSDKFSKPVLT